MNKLFVVLSLLLSINAFAKEKVLVADENKIELIQEKMRKIIKTFCHRC